MSTIQRFHCTSSTGNHIFKSGTSRDSLNLVLGKLLPTKKKEQYRVGYTVWKVSKYRVFSGPYFPVFELSVKVSVKVSVTKY